MPVHNKTMATCTLPQSCSPRPSLLLNCAQVHALTNCCCKQDLQQQVQWLQRSLHHIL